MAKFVFWFILGIIAVDIVCGVILAWWFSA